MENGIQTHLNAMVFFFVCFENVLKIHRQYDAIVKYCGSVLVTLPFMRFPCKETTQKKKKYSLLRKPDFPA